MIDIKLDKAFKDYRITTDQYNYKLSRVIRDKEGNLSQDKEGKPVYRVIAYLHSFKDAVTYAKRYELEVNPKVEVTNVDEMIAKIADINHDFTERNWH